MPTRLTLGLMMCLLFPVNPALFFQIHPFFFCWWILTGSHWGLAATKVIICQFNWLQKYLTNCSLFHCALKGSCNSSFLPSQLLQPWQLCTWFFVCMWHNFPCRRNNNASPITISSTIENMMRSKIDSCLYMKKNDC